MTLYIHTPTKREYDLVLKRYKPSGKWKGDWNSYKDETTVRVEDGKAEAYAWRDFYMKGFNCKRFYRILSFKDYQNAL